MAGRTRKMKRFVMEHARQKGLEAFMYGKGHGQEVGQAMVDHLQLSRKLENNCGKNLGGNVVVEMRDYRVIP